MQTRLDAAIDAHAEQAFAFLEALVAAPSPPGHEQAALEVFAREAGALGLEITRLPFANGPVDDPRAGVAPPLDSVSPDRFQVLAATPGTGRLKLLLNGHMDVVPPGAPELWTTPPYAPDRRDGRLYGRGSSDMKSGFAIGLLALAALKEVVPDLFARERLGFIAVIEEECTGNGALRSLADNGVTADEAVLLESTDLGLLMGGVGILWIDARIIASASHANTADRAVNALELGMRLVAGLRAWTEGLRQSDPEPGMDPARHPYVVNLGRVAAGDWISSAPAVATFGIRVGYPRSWSADEAETRLRAAIAEIVANDPAFPAQPVITLSGFRAEGYLLDDDAPLARDLAAAHAEAHGAEPARFMLGSTTDARVYLNDFAIPAVCYGASGGRFHGIDEYVELATIVDAARTLARFILKRFQPAEVTV